MSNANSLGKGDHFRAQRERGREVGVCLVSLSIQETDERQGESLQLWKNRGKPRAESGGGTLSRSDAKGRKRVVWEGKSSEPWLLFKIWSFKSLYSAQSLVFLLSPTLRKDTWREVSKKEKGEGACLSSLRPKG